MEKTIKGPIIVLVGPTAIGKTALSLNMAERYNCEIVSLDSMQVYRYMNIGTAKATPQERQEVNHHLIDIVDPDEPYDAKQYALDASEAILQIQKRSKIPLITGGTGLYLRSLTEGLFDEIGEFPDLRTELREELAAKGTLKLHEELSLIDCISAKRIHHNDTHRILRALEIYRGTGRSWSAHIAEQKTEKTNAVNFLQILQLGLTCDRQRLYERINMRTKIMLQQGLKEEVLKLLDMGYSKDLKPMQAIGYKHMTAHLFDNWTLQKTEELLARDTRRYAKRQYTWFKKMDITWCEVDNTAEIFSTIDNFLR